MENLIHAFLTILGGIYAACTYAVLAVYWDSAEDAHWDEYDRFVDSVNKKSAEGVKMRIFGDDESMIDYVRSNIDPNLDFEFPEDGKGTVTWSFDLSDEQAECFREIMTGDEDVD